MKKPQSFYATLIADATGAPPRDLPKIEALMREQIFHSTLDWQSPSEFAEGAREAYALLRGNRGFYEVYFAHVQFLLDEAEAERRVRETATALVRAEASGKPARIEKCRLADEKSQSRLARIFLKRRITAEFLERLFQAR